MKIERLYLKAYGAFSEHQLDLRDGPNFHVIYGPNEAGKSTTLRALVGLLFGIEERTDDDFIHAKPQLRIGAVLATGDATRLAVMRRKGRKQTLFALDEDSGEERTEQPLAEDTLTRLLGGLDEGLYRALFGLDLDGLTRGGKELLEGKGEIGRSLFAAAAGLADLRRVSDRLEADASRLFRPRASTSDIQVALKELEEQRKRVREATIRSATWEQTEQAKQQAEKKYADLCAERDQKREQQRRLSRIVVHLPLVAERAAKLQDLATLATVPLLPPEAGQQRIEAEERLRGALDNQREARATLDELNQQRAQRVVREALLQQASAIERLHHAAKDYRGALERLPRIKADLTVAQQTLVKQLSEIDPTLAAELASADLVTRTRPLLPSPTVRARVQTLLEEHGRWSVQDAQLEERERELTELWQRLREERTTQPVPIPFEKLEQAREQATASGDLSGQQTQAGREIVELETALSRDAASLWDGPLDTLILLRVPPLTTVTEIAEHQRQWAEAERALKNQDGILQRDIGERERELRALAASGELVTHDQVQHARQERDASWRQIRRDVVDAVDIEQGAASDRLVMNPAAGTSLIAVFEQALREADRLADLLHADTERATQAEQLRQRIADMQKARSELADEFTDLSAKRVILEARWQAIAVSLQQPDLSPNAAAEWLQKRAALVERFARLEALCRKRDEIDAALVAARQNLDLALQACDLPGLVEDETLSAALSRTKIAIEQGRRDATTRTTLDSQIRQCESEQREVVAKRTKLAERQTTWQERWSATLTELRLPLQSLPAEARARIDQWDRISQTLNDLEILNGEYGRERDTQARFEEALSALAQAVDEPIADQVADQVASTLYAALREAREADQRRKQIDDAIARERQRFDQAETAATNQRERLVELSRRAGAESPEELAVVEERAARKRQLSERVAEIEEQLVRGAARPLTEVLTEVEGESLDTANTHLDALDATIREYETEMKNAYDACVEARRTFALIDGGDVAACARQEAESISARIAGQSRAYARARLAAALVSRVVQIYREKHQGPVLSRASTIFARMTLGRFDGLVMDYQDDRQILLGRRADGTRVTMEGLSQGTRDQLFLALRIAAIEEHLREREAIPIAIDDVLVQFDDARAAATLQILAELARCTQVLFFTHHGHLCELAKTTLPRDSWRQHDLSVGLP